MNAQTFYNDLLIASFLTAAVVFVALFFFAAPYGRHTRKGWGPAVRNKLAWIVMEAPSPLLFGACFLIGNNHSLVPLVFLGLWEAHYLHRAFIYPFSLRGNRPMPVMIIGFGFLFNLMNAYLNGHYIFTLSTQYTGSWLTDPRFIGGLTLFVVGYLINRNAALFSGILDSIKTGRTGKGISKTRCAFFAARWKPTLTMPAPRLRSSEPAVGRAPMTAYG